MHQISQNLCYRFNGNENRIELFRTNLNNILDVNRKIWNMDSNINSKHNFFIFFRIGHISFTNADDAKEALAIKNRRINGNYVQVTTDRSAAVKRLRKQDVSNLPAKKAKVHTLLT